MAALCVAAPGSRKPAPSGRRGWLGRDGCTVLTRDDAQARAATAKFFLDDAALFAVEIGVVESDAARAYFKG